MMLNRTFLLGAVVAVTLSGCGYGFPYDIGTLKRDVAARGEFWQRTNAAEAGLVQGPKAQHMLNRDLSRCVTELSELVRLGQIKSIIPAEAKDIQSAESDAQARLRHWDTPERDGALLAEGGMYHDLDTCMKTKGWERVAYVPYDTADRAAGSYIANHREFRKWQQYTYQPETIPGRRGAGDYGRLNK